MSKISTYEVVPVPKLADKLIGTSVGGEIEDVTYNFTLQELLDLYIPLMPANNLQGILDFGNTATQDINLFGTINTTNLNVTDTANLYITYLNEETHIVGSVFDSLDLVGTPGQVLTSTGEGVEWYTLPPIFVPNLQQVLTEGNTADIDILLDANLEALDVSADTASIANNITLLGTITDGLSSVGSAGQVLESTVTGVQWVDLPVYSATSPLLFNSATKTFSIQVANSTQGGYLTANDWITFNGKQNAGDYITALTGEATATGPGSVPITLNNASVIAKVLTGLNVTGGSISASDSILTAFGKVQNQINGLVGGVQYQGTWNANTNTPTLTSSVGTQGHFYIVNVAGNTDLNGITDWKVGDWAIFNNSAWTKVDNTESVTSVNGQVGAVSLTTDDIPEGATNLYYLNSRARAALSFAAGSGAYNSLTGVITIPTDNNQILNGAGYITLASLSATAPLTYNNLTGAFGIPKATTLVDGYLSATDWTTFNNKQNYLGGTGLVKSTAGTITYITDNSGNWNTAYDRSIVSAAVTGTTTKTLTLNEQDGNTITASWTDLDTGLTSVGVSMPSAFSVANSPLTSNGTIAITGAGTTLEYIDGTGALRTFPALTGYVPYTGATTNVDLGEYGISAGYFQADLTPSGALQVGRMQWNSVDGTMDLRLMGNNVTLQIGEENVTRVVNKSGIDLLEANYQVVRIRKVAEGGAQGQRLAVVLAQGNSENNSTEVLGLVTETILVNQEGFVTNFGEVKEIDTTGTLQGETWVDGNILYLSDTVAGGLTNVRPVAPNHSVIVGYVTYAHAVHGKIYVAVDTGYELGELHNVYAPSPANNASIWWNSSTLRYENNTIAGILGYTPADNSLVVHLAGNEDITGFKTFTGGAQFTATAGTYLDYGISLEKGSIPSMFSSSRTNIYSDASSNNIIIKDTSSKAKLVFDNSTQTYTFPAASGTIALVGGTGVGTVTSVAALTLGTSGTDLSSTVANPTTTPVITLNVPTASAANRGALSSSDWSTFNNKVSSVTASSPLASSGGTTPNITIQQASGTQDGYLSSTDWNTFNNKQAAGNYITSLTGEATASGPGAASVTLSNSAVTGKVLTGVNITGGSISATDSILTAFGKVQNQINGLIGSTIYQGTWNASTNTPALASGVGTRGWYYIVNVAGSTNLDGITDWNIGDWAIFDGTAWQQVDNTDSVSSVNGFTGAVSLTTDNIPEGTTNLYFTNTRAQNAITLTTTGSSGAATYSGGVLNIPNYGSALTAYVPYTGATGNVNIGLYSLTGNSATLNGNASNSATLALKQTGLGIAASTGYATLASLSANNLEIYFGDTNLYAVELNNSLLTASRQYKFPNASGTLALTSDIPSLTGYISGSGTANRIIKYYGSGTVTTAAASNISDDGAVITANASGAYSQGLRVYNDLYVYNTINLTDNSYTPSGFIQGTSNELRFYSNNNVLALTLTSAQKAILPNDATINGLTVGKGAGSLSYSTAFGVNASASNTTGNYLTSIGRDTNRLNTTGQENTAIGAFALSSNTTGDYNTAVGSGSLAGVNGGSQNTAIGLNAGTQITTGNKNTIVGAFSGNSITTGTGNTIIGANLSGFAAGLSDNVIIGSTAAVRMQVSDVGRFGFNYTPVTTRSFLFKGIASTAINFEIVEAAFVHSIYFTPNNGGNNTITSNYFSGGAYLPLALSGRENFTDLVLNTSGNVVIGSATDGGGKFEVRTSTYNRISTYFSGSYISGFKFSDLYGGISYDASIDTLELFSNYPAGKMVLKTNGTAAISIASNQAVTFSNTITSTANGYTTRAIYITGNTQPSQIAWWDSDDLEQYTIGMVGNSGSGKWGLWTSTTSTAIDISVAIPKFSVNPTGTTSVSVADSTNAFNIYGNSSLTAGSRYVIMTTGANAPDYQATDRGAVVNIGTRGGGTQYKSLATEGSAFFALSGGGVAVNASNPFAFSTDDRFLVASGSSGGTQIRLQSTTYTGGSSSLMYNATTGEFRITQNDGGVGTTFYTGTTPTQRLTISTSALITSYCNITVDKGSPTLRLAGSAYGNSGARVQFEGWASGSGYSNWQIDTAFTGNNQLNFVPSTTAGGSTFTTPVFQISAAGQGDFASSVTANGTIQVSDGSTATIRVRGGGYGASYNTSLRSIPGAIGILQFGNNADNYILVGNTAVGGYLSIRVNCTTESISAGTEAVRINANGSTNFYNTVYSSSDVIAYYSSDRRLKDNIINIEDGIEKIKKLNGVSFNWNDKQDIYEIGKKDYGVIAQDVETIMPELVETRANGYKAVKYEKLISLLIEGIKEQQKQIDELKKQIS